MAAAFAVQILARHHDIASFDCGDPWRNAWLQARAFPNSMHDYSQTYVAVASDQRVLGFYALSTSSVARNFLPSKERHGATEPVTAVLLGQLAVAKSEQGRNLGERLVVDAFQRVLAVAAVVGCRLLVVHPAHEWLIPYYSRLGFRLAANATPTVMIVTVPRLRYLLSGD